MNITKQTFTRLYTSQKVLILFVALLLGVTGCETNNINTISCSDQELIDAINDANSTAGSSIIALSSACVYNFHTVDNETNGSNGLPSVTSEISILGNGATIIGGRDGGSNRIFHVSSSGNLTFENLTLAGGTSFGLSGWQGRGGAILNFGNLTIFESEMIFNRARQGGGIYNAEDGNLTIQAGTSFSLNSADDEGAGLYNSGIAGLVGVSIFDNNALNISGTGDGGGIFNTGVLEIESSNIYSNVAANGGGLHTSGDVEITNCTFVMNSAASGGGITQEDGGSIVISQTEIQENEATAWYGGGILILTGNIEINNETNISGNIARYAGGGILINQGSLIVIDSDIDDNSVTHSQFEGWNGGGGLYSSDSTVEIIQGAIRDNSSVVDGGGIWSDGELYISDETRILNNDAIDSAGGGIWNDGFLSIISSSINENEADTRGGGVRNGLNGTGIIENTLFDSNLAADRGGGIENIGELTISESQFINNSSTFGDGGAIWSSNQTTGSIEQSVFSGNRALAPFGRGGALYRWGGEIFNSTFLQNSAAFGGAVYSNSHTKITNSTFSENTAIINGGGLFIAYANSPEISHSTFAYNSGLEGGGAIWSGDVPSGTEGTWSDAQAAARGNIRNSIMAYSPNGGDCGGEVVNREGINIDSDGSCAFGTATLSILIVVDPLLGPLQNNGGQTETHALLAGSQALDMIDPSDCSDVSGNILVGDQRTVPRPAGGLCDLGAYEDSNSPVLGGGEQNIAPPALMNATCSESGERVLTFGTEELEQSTKEYQLGAVDRVASCSENKSLRTTSCTFLNEQAQKEPIKILRVVDQSEVVSIQYSCETEDLDPQIAFPFKLQGSWIRTAANIQVGINEAPFEILGTELHFDEQAGILTEITAKYYIEGEAAEDWICGFSGEYTANYVLGDIISSSSVSIGSLDNMSPIEEIEKWTNDCQYLSENIVTDVSNLHIPIIATPTNSLDFELSNKGNTLEITIAVGSNQRIYTYERVE